MNHPTARDLDLTALPKVLTEDMLMQLAAALKHGKVEMDALQKVLKKKDMIEVISYTFDYATKYARAAYDFYYDRENTFTPVKDMNELRRMCGLSEKNITVAKKTAANMR